MSLKFYIVEKEGKIQSEGEGEIELFKKIKQIGVKKAILLGKENAIYFEFSGEKYVMVGVDRTHAGFARIYAKKILREDSKKIDLKSLEEIFEFAKKVESADLDELAKLR